VGIKQIESLGYPVVKTCDPTIISFDSISGRTRRLLLYRDSEAFGVLAIIQHEMHVLILSCYCKVRKYLYVHTNIKMKALKTSFKVVLSCHYVNEINKMMMMMMMSYAYCTVEIIHGVSKNAQTLASCSFDKHGLILIIFGKQHQHTLKNDIHVQLS